MSPRERAASVRESECAPSTARSDVCRLIASDYRRIRPEFTWLGFLKAYCCDETFAVLVWYRLAHHWSFPRPCLALLLPCYLMLRRLNRRSGVMLSRHVRIGPGFRIEHAGKSYIHKDVVFGADCTIMHNVTLGVSHSRRGSSGVPVVGDRVFIGPNAVLYGGIHVGDDAMIGANSVVNRDVPPNALAVGCPAVIKPPSGPGPADRRER